jgi:biopolymer transport protein ExbD
LYFANKWIPESELKGLLKKALADSGTPLVLIVHADQDVPYKMLVGLTLTAREAGISEALLATLPNPVAP